MATAKKPTADYYAVLEVAKTATADVIKRSWRSLALKHHPDKNGGTQAATEKFQLIQEAWEILGDVSKRQAYDRTYRPQTTFTSNWNHTYTSAPPSNTTSSFFNQQYESHREQKADAEKRKAREEQRARDFEKRAKTQAERQWYHDRTRDMQDEAMKSQRDGAEFRVWVRLQDVKIQDAESKIAHLRNKIQFSENVDLADRWLSAETRAQRWAQRQPMVDKLEELRRGLQHLKEEKRSREDEDRRRAVEQRARNKEYEKFTSDKGSFAEGTKQRREQPKKETKPPPPTKPMPAPQWAEFEKRNAQWAKFGAENLRRQKKEQVRRERSQPSSSTDGYSYDGSTKATRSAFPSSPKLRKPTPPLDPFHTTNPDFFAPFTAPPKVPKPASPVNPDFSDFFSPKGLKPTATVDPNLPKTTSYPPRPPHPPHSPHLPHPPSASEANPIPTGNPYTHWTANTQPEACPPQPEPCAPPQQQSCGHCIHQDLKAVSTWVPFRLGFGVPTPVCEICCTTAYIPYKCDICGMKLCKFCMENFGQGQDQHPQPNADEREAPQPQSQPQTQQPVTEHISAVCAHRTKETSLFMPFIPSFIGSFNCETCSKVAVVPYECTACGMKACSSCTAEFLTKPQGPDESEQDQTKAPTHTDAPVVCAHQQSTQQQQRHTQADPDPVRSNADHLDPGLGFNTQSSSSLLCMNHTFDNSDFPKAYSAGSICGICLTPRLRGYKCLTTRCHTMGCYACVDKAKPEGAQQRQECQQDQHKEQPFNRHPPAPPPLICLDHTFDTSDQKQAYLSGGFCQFCQEYRLRLYRCLTAGCHQAACYGCVEEMKLPGQEENQHQQHFNAQSGPAPLCSIHDFGGNLTAGFGASSLCTVCQQSRLLLYACGKPGCSMRACHTCQNHIIEQQEQAQQQAQAQYQSHFYSQFSQFHPGVNDHQTKQTAQPPVGGCPHSLSDGASLWVLIPITGPDVCENCEQFTSKLHQCLDCKVKVCPGCREALATHFGFPLQADGSDHFDQENLQNNAGQTCQAGYQGMYQAAYSENAEQMYQGAYQQDGEYNVDEVVQDADFEQFEEGEIP